MSRNAVLMVARREFRTRMLTKSNIISLAVMLVIIVAGAVVLSIVADRADDDGPAVTLGLDQETQALGPHLLEVAAARGLDLEARTMNEQEGTEALTAEEDDARIAAYLSGDPTGPRMLVDGEDPEVQGIVTDAVVAHVMATQIEALGGDPVALNQMLMTAGPQVTTLAETDGDGTLDESTFDGPAFLVSVVMISVLLFALIGAGSMISMGVVEEKTSRVVELLLSTIKPTQLLAGKILGIGAYGLFQIVVLGGALAGAVAATGLAGDVELDVGGALVLLIVWFLLGYALYALLFGGFAALVSRQEEIGSVTTPLMFLMFVPFYVTLFVVVHNPEGTVAKVMTYIPFSAPFVTPVRDALGGLEAWELWTSVGICLVTLPVLVWIAARVYQRGVLHTGGRMKLSEALKG